MQKPESKIVKPVKDYLNSLPKAFFIKTHGSPFSVHGLPDLIGTINGRFVSIEIKLPGKKSNVTTTQEYYIHKLQECNCLAFVACSLEEVKSVIADYWKTGYFGEIKLA